MPVNNPISPVPPPTTLDRASVADDKTAMAYTQRLQECQLDRSLASLKRLDLLLSQIRHELLESKISEAAFLTQPSGRRFLLFVGRYAGQVLAGQWQQPAQWLTVPEISEIIEAVTPNLDAPARGNNDFYQQLACQYRYAEHHTDVFNTITEITAVFFPLEVVGARLFASLNRPFHSITGEPIESGLYQAVRKRLPASMSDEGAAASADLAKQTAALEIAPAITKNRSLRQQGEGEAVTEANNPATLTPTLAPVHNEPVATPDLHTPNPLHPAPGVIASSEAKPVATATLPTASVTAPTAPTLANETLQSLAAVRPSESKVAILAAPAADPLAALHTELLKDLHTFAKPQSAGEDEYQKAVKILDVFEGFVAAQKRPRSEVQLSASHTLLREEAVALLSHSAEQGHTAAMLRLAMQKMLGEGTEKDLAEGANWVQKAASRDDTRAQRLLSKLYYQGLGVSQDLTLGKHWLEQAAKNGHPEAQHLVEQWQQVEILTSVQQQEQVSNKRYLLLFVGIGLLALLLVLLL